MKHAMSPGTAVGKGQQTSLRSRAFRLDPADPVFTKRTEPNHPKVAFRLPETMAAPAPPSVSLDDWCVLTGLLAFRLDLSGRIIQVTTNISDRLGLSADACLGTQFSSLSWSKAAEPNLCEEFLSRLKQVGWAADVDVLFADRFGLKRPFRCNGIVYRETEGASPTMLITAIDCSRPHEMSA